MININLQQVVNWAGRHIKIVELRDLQRFNYSYMSAAAAAELF